MANKITLEFEVTDKGTLKQVTSDTNKLSKAVKDSSHATDQASNSKNRYSKLEKGSAQLTSNTTKSFAKQAQTIGSGLVPAYATLAANIFAVSAAFGALKRAAGLEQLEAGLIAVGSAAGQNLPYIADQLREITGAAISTQSAMESVALGTSAGFSTTQMEELTRVAKGASLALGRDMEDAMSRLVRGAAKLEPEILDELGIMVRLDDVTRTYAENLGKTADSLTNFERRMAFTNAIIDQGTQKFGQIAEKIDPNPYNQLAARFRDLTKGVLELVNTGLGPFLNLIANNTNALIGVLGIFGTSVASKMLPALYETAEAATRSAENFRDLSKEQLKQIKITSNLPKGFKDLSDSIKSGTISLEEQRKALDSLNRSLRGMTDATDPQKLEDVTEARKKLTESVVAHDLANVKDTQSASLAAVARGEFKEALNLQRLAMDGYSTAMHRNMEVQGKLGKALSKTKIAVFNLTSSLKLAGTAFLRFLPYIGLAVTAFGLLQSAWDKLFGKGKLQKQAEEVVDSFESFNDINDTLLDSIDRIEALKESTSDAVREAKLYTTELKTQVGILDQVSSGIQKLIKYEDSRDMERIIELKKEERELQAELNEETGIFTSLLGRNAKENRLEQIQKRIATAQENLQNVSVETAQVIADTVVEGALVQIDANEGLKASLTSVVSDIEALQKVLQDPDSTASERAKALVEFEDAQNAIKKVKEELEGLEASSRSFNNEFRKVLETEDKPFSEVISSLNSINNAFKNIKGNSDALEAAWQELPDSILDILGEKTPDPQGLQDYINKWVEASNAISTAEQKAKEFEDSAKKLEGLLEIDPTLVDEYYNKLDAGVQQQITALEKEQDLLGDSVDARARILEIDQEITKLEEQKSTVAEQNITFIESYVARYETLEKLSNKVTENVRARLEAERSLKEEELRMAASEDGEISAKEELRIFEELKADRISAAKEEAEIKRASIESEYMLAQLQFELLQQEFKLADKEMPKEFADRYQSLLERGESSALKAVEAEQKLALKVIESESQEKLNEYKSAVEELMNSIEDVEFDFDVEGLSSALEGLGDHADSAKGVLNIVEVLQEIPKAHEAEMSALDEVKKKRAEVEKTTIAGSQERADAISALNAKEVAIEKQAAQSKLAIYGQTTSAIGGLLSSLAEKQDTTTKEGFEKQKNMQMASAVVNTAGAVMNALATMPYPASLAMAAAAAATGAAQIARIKSTEFGDSDSSGGGTLNAAGGASAPTGGRPQTSGTVLGDPTKTSESVQNVTDLLDTIHAKEYRELKGIHTSIEALNGSMKAIAGAYVRSIQDIDFDQFSKPEESVLSETLQDVFKFLLDPATKVTKWLTDAIGWGDNVLGALFQGPLNVIDDLISGLFDGLFGKTSVEVTDYGIGFGKITGRAIDQGYSPGSQTYTEVTAKTESWFGSDKSVKYKYGELPNDVARLFDQALGNIVDSMKQVIDSIGGRDDLERLMNYEFDLGGRISFKGLTGEEIQKKIEDIINTQMDLAADAVLGDLVAKYQELDEGLFETAIRLMATKEVFAQSMSELGNVLDRSVRDSNEAMLEISLNVVEMVGGVEEFHKAIEGFTDAFFTEYESYKVLQSDMQSMVGWWSQIPDTRQGMKDYIANLDMTSEIGQRTFAELMSNTEKLDEYYAYLEKVSDKQFEFEAESVRILQGEYASLVLEREKELETLRELNPALVAQQEQVWALQELEKRRDLELEILYLSGDGVNAIAEERKRELEALAPSVHAVQKQVWALEDLQGYQDQQIEILNLLGKEEQATAMERKEALGQLTEVGKQLQMQIYNIEDYIDRTETLANAEDQLAEARDNATKSIDDLINKLLGSDKSPVQSMEYYEGTYSELQDAIANARTPQELTDAVDSFTRFSENYLDYMAAYGGNYRDAFDSTMGILKEAKETVSMFSDSMDGSRYSYVENVLTDILGESPSSDQILKWAYSDLEGNTLVSAIVNSLEGGDLRRASTQSYLESMFGSDIYENYKNSLGINLPGYATGGYHTGGWRLVGEQGPELEYTGSSRIYSNSDSTKMIADAIAEALSANNGGGSNMEVKVYLGTREMKDYHVEWHRTDDETHKAVRREVR